MDVRNKQLLLVFGRRPSIKRWDDFLNKVNAHYFVKLPNSKDFIPEAAHSIKHILIVFLRVKH